MGGYRVEDVNFLELVGVNRGPGKSSDAKVSKLYGRHLLRPSSRDSTTQVSNSTLPLTDRY